MKHSLRVLPVDQPVYTVVNSALIACERQRAKLPIHLEERPVALQVGALLLAHELVVVLEISQGRRSSYQHLNPSFLRQPPHLSVAERRGNSSTPVAEQCKGQQRQANGGLLDPLPDPHSFRSVGQPYTEIQEWYCIVPDKWEEKVQGDRMI